MQATRMHALAGWRGDAVLYRLDSSVIFEDGTVADHVVVSAVDVLGDPETYIFPATMDGEVLSWAEAPGSFRGALDHDQAIKGLVEWVERYREEVTL